MQAIPPPDAAWPEDSEPGGAEAAPGVAARPERPGPITAAGVILIVLGAIFLFFGAIAVLVGGALTGVAGELEAQGPAIGETMAAIFGSLGLIIFGWGLVEILVGGFILAGRGWARIAGIVVAVVSGGVALVGLVNREAGGGAVFTVLIVAAYGFTVWALAAHGRWFGAAR